MHKYVKLYKNKSGMNKDVLLDYENTIKHALDNNIKVILIRHPITPEFSSLLDDKIKNDVNEYIQKISIQYNLKILDYRNVFKLKQYYFLNQDHLNIDGEKEFSTILTNDIIKLKY